MKFFWQWSHVFGPLLLYVIGVFLKTLGSQTRRLTWEHMFFSQEIALSNAGSVLSALVLANAASVNGRGDAQKMSDLLVLGVVAVLLLFLVTYLHRAFDDHPGVEKRSKMCIFMLGIFGNVAALSAFTLTLYHTSGHADNSFGG